LIIGIVLVLLILGWGSPLIGRGFVAGCQYAQRKNQGQTDQQATKKSMESKVVHDRTSSGMFDAAILSYFERVVKVFSGFLYKIP
jgi:hypothetical protein